MRNLLSFIRSNIITLLQLAKGGARRLLGRYALFRKMDTDYKKEIIGYSGLEILEECYVYNENACFLADNQETCRRFLSDCGYESTDYRIDPISFDDIMDDYGCSCGEYAMEKRAFENFKKIAQGDAVKYSVKEFDSSLLVINVNT